MNIRLRKAIQQILLTGSTAVFAAGAMATVGIQTTPPGKGEVPDYFGVVPNYANSPQPVLATVTIAPATSTSALDTIATAAATTYDYNTNAYTAAGGIADIQVLNPGSGYVDSTGAVITPAVTIAGGLTATNAQATAHVNGIISIKVSNGGSAYKTAPLSPPTVTISAPDMIGGIQATAIATLNNLGVVTGIQVINAGSGYTILPNVSFSGGTFKSATSQVSPSATALFNPTAGKITSVSVDVAGTGYSTPITGTGIKKFVDLLPGIPNLSSYVNTTNGYKSTGANQLDQSLTAAVADKTTFPGDDYYEIAEVEYVKKLHSDLPATHLRGYVQIQSTGSTGFTVAGFNSAPDKLAYASKYANYLGPVIVAQKYRATRIKLVNLLSKSTDLTGPKGDLPFPVDTTYMGTSRTEDTQNRTALHLHGGNTPWISDGTPRQTIKPVGEGLGKAGDPGVTNPNKGVSATDVPDMWFDSTTGNLLANSPLGVNANGEPIGCQQGTPNCSKVTYPNATNNPGDGALTFYYTNEQSARLMFYHDHAEGITRLNVYGGLAAGYVLLDPTEQAMVHGGTAASIAAVTGSGYPAGQTYPYDSNYSYTTGTLPDLPDTIPLVIQEKTFVPSDTTPVLNAYGPFASQLNSQDPTWRWGSKAVDPINGNADTLNGTGDLWLPHVFMPNQNPGDVSGGNAMGRWDYGPWFWPPFTGIQHNPIANPYYDPACVSSKTNYCEGAFIPGVPNGNISTTSTPKLPVGYPDTAILQTLGSPSATPEAFNDTPLVNGTVYPVLKIDPKKYRLRLLSVGNDRMLNLSLVVAASNKSKTTPADNIGPSVKHKAVLCDGGPTSPVNPAECTEVKMVPFIDPAVTGASPFPSHWYTVLNGGVTFDGRKSGVFDPDSRGPAMVQIGTEGGFLSSPVVIPNQPVNFEYNGKNIVVTNIKEHALLLGPAERADVLVDFSNFAGSTLILYNDAPAPVPAFDLRLDYYTGDPDNTDTGGASSTLPGYGPNSRTLMQIQVAATCATGTTCSPTSSHPLDDIGNIDLPALTTAVQAAFKTSQEQIIVPQAAYNDTYGTLVNDNLGANVSRISDNNLIYNPLDPVSGLISGLQVNLDLQPKTIIEDWTMTWGRMNALLGIEVPRTSFLNATSIPQAYIDPPTELVKISPNDGSIIESSATQLKDGTQLWKVTHNGVDSHAIHFHLFNVQIVNRVGWDGAIRAPEANELGWKDTVLMHPLEDIVVALRPKTMTNLPFKVPNSYHELDPSHTADNGADSIMYFNLDPTSGNASNVVTGAGTGAVANNATVNYGWEYVWHCHILGHEENDMMRSIAVAETPEQPKNLSFTKTTTVGAPGAPDVTDVTLTWTDDSIISNWVTIERTGGPLDPTSINVVVPVCHNQAGCTQTHVDQNVPAGNLSYRVIANNTVGGGDIRADLPLKAGIAQTLPTEVSTLTPSFTGYANVTASSKPSSTVSVITAFPFATMVPASGSTLTFGDQLVASSSLAKTVNVTNTGSANLVISNVALATGSNFAISNYGTCFTPATPVASAIPGTLIPGASCSISVTFKPSSLNGLTDTLTITDNMSLVTSHTVILQGTGVAPGVLTWLPPTTALDFGIGKVLVGQVSVAQTVTLTNPGNASLPMAISVGTPFVQSNDCGVSLGATKSCTVSVSYQPITGTAETGSLIVNGNTLMGLSGTGAKLAAATGLASNLVTYNAAGSTVALGFSDNSTYETGYQVQFCRGSAAQCTASSAPPALGTTSNVATNINQWYTVPGAFNVTGSGQPGAIGAASLTVPGLILSNNTNTSNYMFRVYPLFNATVGAVSNITPVAMSLNTRPLALAAGSVAASAQNGIATVTWQDVANNNAGYNVQLQHVNYLSAISRVTRGTKTYSTAPTVQFVGSTGGAAAVANLDANGRVTSITINNAGTYSTVPTVTLTGGSLRTTSPVGGTESSFTAIVTVAGNFATPAAGTMTPALLNGVANTAQVSGLQIGGSYNFQVRANGANGNNSAYTVATPSPLLIQ